MNRRFTTPVLVTASGINQLLIFHDEGIRSLDPDTGNELWKMPMWIQNSRLLIITTPVVHDNLVFFSGYWGVGSMLLKVHAKNAEKLWHNKKIQCYQANPHIINGAVYLYDGVPMQNKKSFVCLDLKTGIKKWETDTLGMGTTIAADGYLICQNVKGALFLVKPDFRGLRLKGSIAVIMPDIPENQFHWTKPVIAGNRLYVRHGPKLICYRLGS